MPELTQQDKPTSFFSMFELHCTAGREGDRERGALASAKGISLEFLR